MIIKCKTPAFFAAALFVSVLAISGCAPITSYNGYQAQDIKPKDIKVGEDTRSTVFAKLGSPSVQSIFDRNIWFYINQTSDKYAYYKPQVRSRDITEIHFDRDEKVILVKSHGLTEGFQIAYDPHETPTLGRELSVVEQILGGLGRGGALPQDNDPGNRPGGGH